MNRFEMDYDDSPHNADYLSLLPRAVRLDIFGTDTSTAEKSLWQGNQAFNYAGNAALGLLGMGLKDASAYLQPYSQAGTAGMQAYAGLLGIPGVSTTYNPMQYLQNVPGYQWGQQQGMNALNSATNAQGLYGSGPQREAAIQYGQNYGTNYYNTLMNQLAGLGNMGQSAGTQLGNWNIGTQQNAANIEMAMGQNAQNTFAGQAGLELQNAQMQSSGLGQMLGLITGLGPLSGLTGSSGGGALFGGGPGVSGAGSGGGGLMNLISGLFSSGGGGGAGYSAGGALAPIMSAAFM